MVQNIFRNHFGAHNCLKSLILDRKWHFQLFETLIFQFSSKTRFLSQYVEDLSCRICSYGPYGPFRFSVKNDLTDKFQSSFHFYRKKHFFEITVRMEFFSKSNFPDKPLAMALEQDYVWKHTPDFQDKPLAMVFGPYYVWATLLKNTINIHNVFLLAKLQCSE